MKKIGIVVEYNPFHNGHVYQINKIKELYPNSCIVVVTSSSFTMRAEISLLNKWQKTEVALNNGVDLVVELPIKYSIQSADTFAEGAIKILNELKIDALAFGTESNNIDKLKKMAEVQINNNDFDKIVKENINKGINYPTSLSNAIKKLIGFTTNEPNDILAISYIKQIIKNNLNIELVGIKRTNSFFDINSNEDIVSASNIRNKFLNNIDFKNSVPLETYSYLNENKFDFELMFKLIKYKIISEKDNLDNYAFIDEGISSRIYGAAIKSNNMEELILNVKTKRYTTNRINRMLISLLVGIKKSNTLKLQYIRILGMSIKGMKHLKSIRGKTSISIINKFKNSFDELDEELKTTIIYSEICNNPDLIKDEYTKHSIIKKH